MFFYTALDRADLGLPTPDLRIQYPPCSPVVGNRILVNIPASVRDCGHGCEGCSSKSSSSGGRVGFSWAFSAVKLVVFGWYWSELNVERPETSAKETWDGSTVGEEGYHSQLQVYLQDIRTSQPSLSPLESKSSNCGLRDSIKSKNLDQSASVIVVDTGIYKK